MSDTKFTPGPWRLASEPMLSIWAPVNIGKGEGGEVLQPIYCVQIQPSLHVDKDGSVAVSICYESWRQFPSVNFCEMQKANAHLISAAPELFEILAELHDVAQDAFNFIGGANPPITREQLIENLRETMAKARSVHAKAEGKQ